MSSENPQPEDEAAAHQPWVPQRDASHYDEPISGSDQVSSTLGASGHRPLSWSGYLSWAFVIGCTALLFSIVAYSQIMAESEIGGDATSAELLQIQIQGKTLVGQKGLIMQGPGIKPANADQFSEVPKSLDVGPYEQRLCYSILVNELNSPEAATEYLGNLDQTVAANDLTLTDDQQRLRQLLLDLMEQYEQGDLDVDSVPETDREFLETKLQWMGKLALLPPGSPRKSERSQLVGEATGLLLTGVIAMILGLCTGLLGILLAIIGVVMLASGKLRSGFSLQATDHNVYIETFAIWMAIFFGCSIALGLIGIEDAQMTMFIQPLVFFGSLVALAWPIARGIPFSRVRKEIGWFSENPLKDVVMAVPAYIATLPFLVPGIIVVSVLMMIVAGLQEPHEFARQVIPSHPVQEYIMAGGVTMILLVFLTACVAAPIVEETMFRGVLYRHLRQWSGRRQRWISVMFSAIFNGLIFAAIHPQGIFGIPVLALLAIGFSLTREWRGSLVSPMLMHGMHNGLVTCISLLIL